MDKVITNGDRIRAMNDEELAREMLFFRPTDAVFTGGTLEGLPCYVGIDGDFYKTADDAIQASLVWLRQPAE
jgi:hypothetical protein